ncbi:MAG: ATP-binding protein [Gammaproteobacteria bacterium]|nr:ATP-binding protein [Gammaproteobacteria bacterium]
MSGETTPSLIDKAGVAGQVSLSASTESAWIEVIQKMDEVYADLVRYQIALEAKNAALEEAQQFIRSVLSAMTDVLIVCDKRGRIEQVNAALERLTGHAAEAVMQQRVEALFMPESRPLAEKFPEKLATGGLVDCEVSLCGANGEAVPLAMNCSARYDHEGRLMGMVLIGRPVGELRRAYDELNSAHQQLQKTQQHLIHSEKMASLGRLVAGVAHELNNPISFVYGNAHALKRYGEGITRYITAIDAGTAPDALRELRAELKIDRILRDLTPLIAGTMEGAERVSDIVQELRRYSASRQEAARAYDVVEVIHKALSWVFKVERRTPQLDLDLPDTLMVEGHPGHVHQILVNLVQNAMDVMEDLGEQRLSIACHVEADVVTISVRDYGPGIPAEALNQVFDPFYSSKPVGKGTGLGLYVSYGMATDLGGELTAINHPDGGALFTLRLPREGGLHERA